MMRRFYNSLFLTCFFCLTLTLGFGQNANYYQTFIILNNGGSTIYYDAGVATSNPDFNGTNLGAFTCTGTLTLNGGQSDIRKGGTCDVTNSKLAYRVYIQGSSTLPSFTEIDLPFSQNFGTCFTDNTCQRWEKSNAGVNLLSGLANGTYVVETYFVGSTQFCSVGNFYDSNFNNNYKATFTVNNPTVPSISGTANICTGGSSILTATCNSGAFVKWADGTLPNPRTVTPATTTSYAATCILGNGTCESSSASYTVNLNNVSIVAQPATQYDCEPNSVRFIANASTTSTGIGSTVTYQWQRKLPSESSFTNLTNGSPINISGNILQVSPTGSPNISGVQFQYIATDGYGCTATSNVASLYLNNVGTITNTAICENTNYSLTVPIASDVLSNVVSYQWEVFDAGTSTWGSVSNGGAISGATTQTLNFTSIPFAQDGKKYRCRVLFNVSGNNDNDGSNNTGAATTCPRTTSEVTLNVKQIPTVPTINTTSPQTRCLGASVTLNSTNCSPNTTSWYESGAVVSTNAIYTFTPAAVGSKTYKATCTKSGCESGFSSDVVVNVNPVPVAPPVTINPVSGVVCQGGSVVLSATFTATKIRWYKQAVGGANQASNNTTTDRTVPGAEVIPADPNTAGIVSYWVEQENTFTCVSPRTQTSFTVKPSTLITSQPTSQTICESSPVTFTVGATGENLSYQWKKGTTNVGTNSPTYTINSVSVADAGNYTCVITGTCGTATTNIATLTVNLLTNISVSPQSQTVCEGATNISFSTTAVGTNLSYQWKRGTTNVGTNASTFTISTVALGDAGDYTCVVTGACNTQTSNAATFILNPTPATPVVVSPVNYCQNASTIALSATTSGSNSLLWYGTNSTGGTSSASAPIPSSSALGTTTYYVSQKTPENCESTRASISVVINENPAVPTTNTTINYCKDAAATALTATASGSNSLIWYDANDNILASAPTPSTSTVGTQTFKVSQKTPSPANCESPKAIITINVFDNPVAPTVTTPVGYCQNTTASALSATATGGNTLLWYGTSATGGISSTSTPTPLTTSTGTTSYYVSQKDVNNCESPRAKIDVEVTPAVSGNITGVNALCLTGVLNSSTTLTANPSGGNGTFGYQWQNLAGNIALATNQTYEVTNAFQSSNSDTYKVTITSGYCTTTANMVVTKQGWNDVPSVSGNTPDICGSGSKILSIVSPNASGTYKWFVDATTNTEVPTGTVATRGLSYTTGTLSSSTTYYVAREQQVTASLTCQTVRTPVTINVISSPPTPTIINSAGDTFFCNNASDFTLSVSCSSGSGQYRLNSSTWITGNSVTVSPITYPANTTFTYDFKCVLSAACESEIASTSITIAPTPTAPTISGNTTICTAGSTTLTASGCIGDVVWNTEDFGSTLNVTTAGTYSAICLNDDCESVSSNVLTVVISAIPAKPTVISDDADNTICAGGSIKLTVSSCAGSVIWSNGTTATFINVSSSGTYSATCTENSCLSPASDIQTITVNTTPTAPTITSDDADNIVCAGTNVILTASNCAGSVIWSNGTTATSITVSASGTYNAQCSVNACLSVVSSLQTIVVNDIPSAPTITSDDADNIVCSGTNVLLTASNCAGSVVWSNGTTATSITVSASGTYTARCSVNNCLSSPSSIQTIVVNAFPVFSTQPISQTNCKGANVSFTGTVNLSSTLQWEHRKTSSEAFAAVGSSSINTTLLFSVSNIGSTSTIYPHGSEFRLKATSNGCITYSDIVTLNVNSVTGDIPDQTKCNGSSTSFDLSSLAIVGTISSYQWEVSTSASGTYTAVSGSQFSGITTNILTINPISDDVPKYYRCKMVFTNTASGNCTITSNSGKLTVTTITPPTISGATAICSGTSTTLTASGCTGTITWSTGVSGSTASVSSAGTYSATCTQSSCTSLASNVHTLTVNAIPSAPTISSDDADNIVCQGTNIVLTASDCAGTIIWSNATTGTTITVSASGTYNATCTVNSCVSATSVLQTIVVNAIPTAPIISGSTSICSGNSTTLTASGCAGTVTWSTGATGSILSVSASGTYNATCTTNGCVSLASSTQTITINSIPDAPTISGNLTLCQGESTTLTASGCAGTVTWSTSATGSTLSISTAGTYNATCTVNSCTSLASVAQEVIVNTTPTAPTVTSDDADNIVCSGTNVILTASNCAGSVVWSNGTTATSITVSASGTYTARCSVNNCLSLPSTLQTIVVNPIPSKPTVVSDDLDNTICSGGNIKLSVSSCAGNVIWSNGTTATFINVSASGTYSAICTENGCVSLASDIQTIVVNTTPAKSTVVSDDLDNTICSGESIKLSVSGCGGNVIWSNGTTATFINVSSSGTYSATCTENGCISPASDVQTIIVNAFPVFSTQPTNQTNCKGASSSFSGTVNLSSTLQWEYRKTSSDVFAAVGSSSTGITLSFSASSIGSTTYPHGSEFRLKATRNGCVTYSNIVTLNVNSVTGDIPDQTKCNGSSTSFDLSSLNIVGTISSYQWEVSTSASSGFGNVTGSQFSGITTNILTINPIGDDVPKYYRCKMVFTNTASGNCTITSNSGKLTVTTITPPTISGATAICSGTSTTLTASGCAGTVTWSTGASGSTLSASSAGSYSATCTQSSCTSLASNVHTLTINAIPSAPTISSDDVDNVVCQGTSIILTASDCAGTIIWSNATTGSTITVSTSGTYNATCTVNNCASATSVLQTIVVNAIPTAPSISGSTSICSGNSTTLTASGCVGIITWSTGLTGSTLSVSAVGTYNATCTVNGCISLASSTQTITINAIPDAPTISGNTTFCVGTSTTLTASGCAGTVTWSTSATGSTLSVSSAGTYNATCTVNSCTSPASSNHVVSENALPSITLSAVNSICNASTTFDLAYTATANAPNKYSLTSAMPDFVAVSETDIPSSPISVIIPSGKTGTHTFILNIKNTTTGCVNSQTFNVTILPVLIGGSIETSPNTINCAGYVPARIDNEVLASGGKSAYTYQWQNSTDGTNFTDISGANQSGFTPTASLTQTTYYRRKVTDACNAEAFSSNNHQVTIVPDPQITLTDASDRVICSGNSFTLDATVLGGSGTCTPTWQSSNSASTGFATEQVGGLSFMKSLTNVSTTPLVKYFRVIYACGGPGSGSCNQSTSGVVKVTVNALPTVPTVSEGGTICSGQSTTLTASGCNGNIVWSNGTSATSVSVSSAGTYTANCVNSCGTSAASSEIVVNVTTINPPKLAGATTICGGQNATLTASGCAGTVVWSNASSGTSIIVNPSTTSSFTATCTANGCTSVVSESVTVTVTPSIDFTVSSIADLCNSSTGFSMPYAVTLGSPDKYSLTSTMSGFTAITDVTLGASPISVSIPSGQIGTFSFTLTLKISGTGCSKSQTFSVTILSVLSGGSIEVSPNTVNCAGYVPASIDSEVLASGGKSTYTYQWQNSTNGTNFTDISGANQSGFTPTAALPQTTYFRRKVTDACGAEAFSSNNHQISIVPDPQITLVDASDKVICSGSSFTLDATVLGGSGTCTPTWQSSNSASTGFAAEQVGGLPFTKSLTNTSATPLVRYFRAIYSCAGTGSGFCNQGISAVVKVTVNYIPLPPTISPASVIICPTQSTTLTASGCSGVVIWASGQTGSTLSVSTSGSYTAFCTINNCTSESSSASIVTLASSGTLVPPPTIAGTATICNGQFTTLTATSCTGLVTWSDGKTGANISVNPSLSTNYTATCNDGTCTSNASNQISVTVNNYPSITTQPKNDADCNGNSVSFTVVASPAMSYQWQRKVPNGTFENILNATAKSLSISDVGSVSDPHQSQYQVIVSNEGCTVTSNPATLTVNSVTGSLADQTVCGGTNVSFNLSTITTTGIIESYQWQKRIGSSGTWNDIVGANTTTLTINNATNADEQYYRCKINFTVGSSTCARYSTEDDTNGAKLTVLVATTPTISGAKAICLGKSTTLSANSCDGNITWSSGQTTTNITVSPTTVTSYTVTCTSPQCAFSETSTPYIVAVNATPVPESITYDVIVPATLTFRVKSSVPNATIMWYTRATGGTGTTTAPPTFSKVGTYGYWATQIDPITGCESPRVPVFAKILDYFHITFQPNTQADCKGNSVNLSVTAVGPVNYFVYQWQRKRPNEPDFVNLTQDGNGIKGWNQQRLTVSNVGSDDNPHLSQYRCVINNEGHFLTSNPATISVNSVIGALPNFGTCVGRNFTINLVNYFKITGNVLSYQWQTRPGTSGDWTDLKDAGNLAGSTTNELKFNNIDYDKAAYYRCLVKFDTQGFICTEPTDATRLIVGGYPSPPEVSDIDYCQFAKPSKLKADKSVFDLIWYNQKTDIVGSSTAPTPNTDVVGTTSYFVAEQTDQGCESPRVEIKVNVEALPPVLINTTSSEVDEGQVLTFSADGTPKEEQILRWYTSPTGTTFTTIVPVFTAVGTYTRYVAQVSAAGCIGPRMAITARIIPNMKFTRQPISQADCDGNSVTFSLTASAPTTFTYQWQRQRPAEVLFTDMANEVSNSLKISDVGDAKNPHLTKYRCIIKDEKGSLISDEVSLVVNEIKGTLSNITLCDGEATKLSFNSLIITGNVLSYQWQKKNGSTYADISTTQEGIANVSEIGTYRGRVTFTIDNKTTCVRTTDDLKVDVKPVPIAPQVANQTICQNTSFNVEKTITATNTLLWYDSAIDTTVDKSAPKIDISKIGKTTFFVSQITQFGCESERKSFDLVISPIPAKPLVSDVSYCRNAPSGALVASTEIENKLLWYASQTAKDAFTQTPIPDTKTDGTTTYYVSAKNTANCESPRVAMKVSVALCIATFENNYNNCVQISADSVKGNKWYDLYDTGGRLYASVNPNGLNLGKVSVSIRHYGRGSAAIPATKNDTKFMARYTDFQSSLLQNFEKPVSLRIYYENAELNEYKTASNLPNLTINDFNIVHYDGVREDCGFENNDNFAEGNSVVIYKNVAGSQVTKDFFYLQFDVNEFSENGATANRFTDVTFAANETPDKTIKLNWQTKFEIKAEKFILQRSADCMKWISLGEIKANSVNGSYEKLDNQPLSGKSCYRLIYIDKDGTKKYLDPIEVTFSDIAPVCSVFPNPWTTGEEVKLYLRNIKEKEIKLYDLVGQQYSFEWKKDELGIIHLRPDSPLVKGTHFIVVVGEDGKRCIQKVVINP